MLYIYFHPEKLVCSSDVGDMIYYKELYQPDDLIAFVACEKHTIRRGNWINCETVDRLFS